MSYTVLKLHIRYCLMIAFDTLDPRKPSAVRLLHHRNSLYLALTVQQSEAPRTLRKYALSGC